MSEVGRHGSLHHVSQLNLAPGWMVFIRGAHLPAARPSGTPQWDKVTLVKYAEKASGGAEVGIRNLIAGN